MEHIIAAGERDDDAGIDQESDAIGTRILRDDLTDPRNRDDEIAIYLRPLRKYPVIRDQERVVELFRRYRAGDRAAYDLLVYCNVRLVVRWALKYSGRGVPIRDLIAEGIFGLFSAIEKYDVDREARLSTYASHWIRQAIQRAIHDWIGDHPYRIPVHLREAMQVVRRALSAFMTEHGHWPNTRECYEVIQLLETKNAAEMRLPDVAACRQLIIEGYTASFDDPLPGDAEDFTVSDTIADPATDLDALLDARRLLAEYRAALANVERTLTSLSPRQAIIIRLRLGLGEFERMTQQEIAERYELTRQRIQQLEAAAWATIAQQLQVTEEEITGLITAIEELECIVASA